MAAFKLPFTDGKLCHSPYPVGQGTQNSAQDRRKPSNMAWGAESWLVHPPPRPPRGSTGFGMVSFASCRGHKLFAVLSPTLHCILECNPLGSKALIAHSVKASLPRNCLTHLPLTKVILFSISNKHGKRIIIRLLLERLFVVRAL